MELVYVKFIIYPEVNEQRRRQASRQADQVYDEGTFKAFKASVYKQQVMFQHSVVYEKSMFADTLLAIMLPWNE